MFKKLTRKLHIFNILNIFHKVRSGYNNLYKYNNISKRKIVNLVYYYFSTVINNIEKLDVHIDRSNIGSISHRYNAKQQNPCIHMVYRGDIALTPFENTLLIEIPSEPNIKSSIIQYTAIVININPDDMAEVLDTVIKKFSSDELAILLLNGINLEDDIASILLKGGITYA